MQSEQCITAEEIARQLVLVVDATAGFYELIIGVLLFFLAGTVGLLLAKYW